ncbi:MAG: hypothetical protein H6624_04760 [Bdellovibrionaceae bacterium]|nr:hypothetical protein [Bdellovibrionales bacterium]MCB9083629.1 hypothetical protein [Pseudobdellovibrionaceae bacterium]
MIYLLAIVLLVTGLFLPWWSVAPICFVAGWFLSSRFKGFYVSAISVMLTWVAAAYYFDMKNALGTGERLAQLFHLPHFTLVYLMIGLAGGLFAACAALAGNYSRRALVSTEPRD